MFISHSSGSWEVDDQGADLFLSETSSLADGHLLTMSLHGGGRGRIKLSYDSSYKMEHPPHLVMTLSKLNYFPKTPTLNAIALQGGTIHPYQYAQFNPLSDFRSESAHEIHESSFTHLCHKPPGAKKEKLPES